jgi:hypothetical protein
LTLAVREEVEGNWRSISQNFSSGCHVTLGGAGDADGARIVTNPTDTLVDGMPVRIAGAPNKPHGLLRPGNSRSAEQPLEKPQPNNEGNTYD